jgi:predicted DNA-binding transcriptional regulator AlpA
MANDNDATLFRAKRTRVPDAWPRGMAIEVVAAYVGVAESTWLREVAADRAPKPTHITPGRCIWLREKVDAWLDQFADVESDWRAELERWQPSK